MDGAQTVQLVSTLVWPIAVVVLALAFRKPLSALVKTLGQRATKMDLKVVSIEFRPASDPDWSVTMVDRSVDVRMLTSDAVFDSFSRTLFDKLSDLSPIDAVEVDFGTGREWLSSRLYLFSALLARIRGVHTIIFLRTANGRAAQVLGVAGSDDVCTALARDEPWLEQSYVTACQAILGMQPIASDGPPLAMLSADQVNPPNKYLDAADVAQNVARAFIRMNQRTTSPTEHLDEWQDFVSSPPGGPGSVESWEHTRWISGDELPSPLRRVLDTRAMVTAVATEAPSELKRRILLQEGPNVLLIHPDGTLRGLVDRRAMLDKAVRSTLIGN